MNIGERSVDDWVIYPVFHRGRIMWAEDGYRWMPNWVAGIIEKIWNPLICWRSGGHTWMTEWADEGMRGECCYCGWGGGKVR